MDKAETITEGKPSLTDIVTKEINQNEFFNLVASAEKIPSIHWRKRL